MYECLVMILLLSCPIGYFVFVAVHPPIATYSLLILTPCCCRVDGPHCTWPRHRVMRAPSLSYWSRRWISRPRPMYASDIWYICTFKLFLLLSMYECLVMILLLSCPIGLFVVVAVHPPIATYSLLILTPCCCRMDGPHCTMPRHRVMRAPSRSYWSRRQISRPRTMYASDIWYIYIKVSRCYYLCMNV